MMRRSAGSLYGTAVKVSVDANAGRADTTTANKQMPATLWNRRLDSRLVMLDLQENEPIPKRIWVTLE
jgi:hypothetical protein